jgi:hypothetical protein
MRAIAAVLLSIVLVSCSQTTGPDRMRRLGTIAGFNSDDPRIVLQPDGRRVVVSVTTYGDGCYTAGETEVVVQGLEAVITPYDYIPAGDAACDRFLRVMVHQVTVAFESPGTARLRIHGIDGGTRRVGNMIGDTVVVEREIDLP